MGKGWRGTGLAALAVAVLGGALFAGAKTDRLGSWGIHEIHLCYVDGKPAILQRDDRILARDKYHILYNGEKIKSAKSDSGSTYMSVSEDEKEYHLSWLLGEEG